MRDWSPHGLFSRKLPIRGRRFPDCAYPISWLFASLHGMWILFICEGKEVIMLVMKSETIIPAPLLFTFIIFSFVSTAKTSYHCQPEGWRRTTVLEHFSNMAGSTSHEMALAASSVGVLNCSEGILFHHLQKKLFSASEHSWPSCNKDPLFDVRTSKPSLWHCSRFMFQKKSFERR